MVMMTTKRYRAGANSAIDDDDDDDDIDDANDDEDQYYDYDDEGANDDDEEQKVWSWCQLCYQHRPWVARSAQASCPYPPLRVAKCHRHGK